jgi:predicted phosphodiesterase
MRATLLALTFVSLVVAPPHGTVPLLAGAPPAQAAAPASAGQAPAAGARGTAPVPRSTLPNEKGSTKFAVIGDTGTGGRQQYEVGKLLSDARARFPYEFVIMMGDNLYGGQGPSDFVKKFETPYKPILDAGIKFYATLGNHDDPAQRFYKPFNMEGKRYYSFRKDDVEFFVLDSTYVTPAQIDWLKDVLPKSNAKWKIPYMHHPLYSSGEKHGSEVDLRTLVEPLFIANGVDVVFAGHEHFYERLKPQNGIYYFTEGGSAKLREGNIRVGSAMTDKGFDTDMSFMLVEIAKDQMFFETISRNGQVIDSGNIPRREIASLPKAQVASGQTSK